MNTTTLSMTTKPQKEALAPQEKLINYYEEAGPDYQAWSKNYNMHFGYYKLGLNPLNREAMLQMMNEQVWQRLNLVGEQVHAADLGCGLGATMRYIASKQKNLQLKGITLVPWQIDQAQKLNYNAGLSSQIGLLQADYTKTPLEDNSMDAVWAIESCCYSKEDDARDLLKEIYRILKPGGRFVIADGFRKQEGRPKGWLGLAYQQLCSSWALQELNHIHRTCKQVEQVGFRQHTVEDISWKVAPSVAHVPFTVLTFLAKELLLGQRKMTPERWDNLKSPLLTMVLGLARKHFGYYIISGTK